MRATRSAKVRLGGHLGHRVGVCLEDRMARGLGVWTCQMLARPGGCRGRCRAGSRLWVMAQLLLPRA